jgi:hypothetical protein
MVRDLRRTGRVFGGSGGSDPISESEVGSGALPVVGLLRGTRSKRKLVTEQSATEWVGEGGRQRSREGKGNQMRKGGEGGSVP